MKISTLQENIKQGLMIVGHIAGKNVNLPILNNVMIEASDGNIKLITTNLEIGVVKTIRGKIEKEGSFTVDSKIFSDYISLIPNNKIEIEEKDGGLLVKTDGYKTKIIGQEAKEFPLIPSVDKSVFFAVSTENFRNALSQVIFASSVSESRIELSGVLFNFDNNKLVLAATDSYRLAEREIQAKTNNNNQEERKIIVPSRTTQELVRVLSGLKDSSLENDEKEVKIYLSDNQVMFSVGGMELVSRVIEGQYPDYRQIFPENNKTEVIINKAQIIKAVKASSLFSKTGINDVNLDFSADKNKTTISSTSSQTGESVIEIDTTIKGENNGVVINYRYLLDGLNSIEEENVKIIITDSNTPCILKPEKAKDHIYIIMPIKQ